MSNSIDFIRYLSAKQTVDDRALNRHVWDALQNALPVVDKLRVVELGAGIGTMLERMLARGLFSGAVEYVLVDENADNIQAARTRLLPLMRQHPHLEVAFITAEAFEWASTPHQHRQYDLLVANAFLDLVNLEAALRQFWALLKPNGLFYFTITFDGVSAFLPPHPVDSQIERYYHADMDARRHRGQPTGGSQAGRALLQHILHSEATVLSAGASDWLVFPQRGQYPADEAVFLHAILNTVEGALTNHPHLNAHDLADWMAVRRAQVEAGALTYLAHQLDLVGVLPSTFAQPTDEAHHEI